MSGRTRKTWAITVASLLTVAAQAGEPRRYTVAEIDSLRSATETRWIFGTTYCADICSSWRTYKTEEKDNAVERMVRTYMEAGITAADIIAEDRRRAPIESGSSSTAGVTR